MLHYHSDFLSEEEADELFEQLKKIKYNSDEDSMVKMAGRRIKIPRKQTAFGDEGVSYDFGSNKVDARPWIQPLEQLRDRVYAFCIKQGYCGETIAPNFALVNLYRNGRDSIGWHRDKEQPLVKNCPILSVSLGASREFKLSRSRGYGNSAVKTTMLKHGSLLVIPFKTNHVWYHSVPKRAKVKDPRINITFRFMKI